MNKTPKLRFKEFSGDWESKKLGTMGEFFKGSTLSKAHLSEDGNPCILYGELYTKYGEVIKNVISKTDLDDSKLVIGQKNDVLIPSSGETAIDIATASCLQQEDVILGGDLNVFRSDKLNGVFASYQLNNSKKLEIAKLAQGASVVHVYNNQLTKLKLSVPSKEEQEKIASLFSLIDDKISLQGEKLEMLKDYKKGMMQKIFSRELRFKDNDGRDYPEWKEKKITEIAKTSIGLVTTMTENYVEDGVKLIRNSDIKENKIKKDNLINLDIDFASQNEHRKLRINDVVTVHTGDIGTSAVIDKEMDGCQGFATLNTRPDNKIIDSYYLCHYFNSFRNKKYAIRMSTGDGRSNYNLKDFNHANILVPCLEEQIKIANTLSNIDYKLEKEQDKLDSLNEYKKGLLQQMFI